MDRGSLLVAAMGTQLPGRPALDPPSGVRTMERHPHRVNMMGKRVGPLARLLVLTLGAEVAAQPPVPLVAPGDLTVTSDDELHIDAVTPMDLTSRAEAESPGPTL